MNIIKKFIKYNYTSKPNRKFDWIIIHDTANRGYGAGALMHYSYFNSSDKDSSADFFIDDKNIVQLVDIDNAYSWHCGDGKGKNGITNSNSIGLEICINPDSNYDIAVNNTVDLVVELMRKYNIPLDKVKRHFDASGKNCPQTMYDNGDWSKWNEFKNKVSERMNNMDNQTKITDVNDALKILVDKGIINSIDYWRNAISVCKYFDVFVLNVANKLKD